MWWNELSSFQQACFIVGCVTGLFMIVQIVLMIVGVAGGDDYADVGSDVDGDIFNDGFTAGLKLLSVRTALAFLCVGGWLGYTVNFYLPWWAALLIGAAGGGAMGFVVALAIRGFEKLQGEGTIVMSNCVGKTGEVYLTIPALRASKGKVNVYVQEAIREFEAVTDSQTPIKTGAQIKVVSLSGETLVVEPLAE